ncbi:MAG: AraC family transcriptional regulator ligand-binding domain-containing protein [Aureispira sp.]
MVIDSNHLKNILEYANCRQISLPTSIKEQPLVTASVEASYYLDIFHQLQQHSKDPYFGLHYGAFLSLKALAVIYDISLVTANLKQLFFIWKQYASASFPLISFQEEEGLDFYSMQLKRSAVSLSNQVLDSILMFAYRELKTITNQPITITLPYQEVEKYHTWFNTPIIQGTGHALTFHAASNKIVSNRRQRHKLSALLPAFLSYLVPLSTQERSFSMRVKVMVLNLCQPDFPTLTKVAAQFCLTERTLQRRLKIEGTSFRQILNVLKKELHSYLKKDPCLKTMELGFILGYSSSSAFLHALKSWK